MSFITYGLTLLGNLIITAGNMVPGSLQLCSQFTLGMFQSYDLADLGTQLVLRRHQTLPQYC